jgi:hypothetical protein
LKTTDKRKGANISTILFSLLQDDDQLKQLKALLSSNKKAKTKDFIVLATFLCLPTDLTSKPLLPISVDTNLPHFLLPIGQPNDDTAFKISVAYDTCAVLNVGWAGFHLAVPKQYPHLVKSLVWANEQYTPLTLSDVVPNDEADTAKAEKLVFTLPAVIEYYMPHPSKQGQPTSFKVTIGNNVAVNTLIGMSMIRPPNLAWILKTTLLTLVSLIRSHFP